MSGKYPLPFAYRDRATHPFRSPCGQAVYMLSQDASRSKLSMSCGMSGYRQDRVHEAETAQGGGGGGGRYRRRSLTANHTRLRSTWPYLSNPFNPSTPSTPSAAAQPWSNSPPPTMCPANGAAMAQLGDTMPRIASSARQWPYCISLVLLHVSSVLAAGKEGRWGNLIGALLGTAPVPMPDSFHPLLWLSLAQPGSAWLGQV